MAFLCFDVTTNEDWLCFFKSLGFFFSPVFFSVMFLSFLFISFMFFSYMFLSFIGVVLLFFVLILSHNYNGFSSFFFLLIIIAIFLFTCILNLWRTCYLFSFFFKWQKHFVFEDDIFMIGQNGPMCTIASLFVSTIELWIGTFFW